MRPLRSEFLVSASKLEEAPKLELPEIAFVGRSNVGKSSAINALLGRKRLARVSNTPGRTRLLNFFTVDFETTPGKVVKVSFCDLPGYGYAKAPRDEIARWKDMIEGYLSRRETLKATIALVDSRTGPTEQDLQLVSWMASLGRPVVSVATKIDKLPKAKRLPELRKIGEMMGRPTPIGFSAETDEGKDVVYEVILGFLGP